MQGIFSSMLGFTTIGVLGVRKALSQSFGKKETIILVERKSRGL